MRIERGADALRELDRFICEDRHCLEMRCNMTIIADSLRAIARK